MIDIALIKSQAVGSSDSLVGVRQPNDTDIITVDTKLTTTRSGLYLQGGSGLVTMRLLKSCLEADITDAQFNTKLTQILQESFVDVLNRIFSVDDLLENAKFFKRASSTGDLETLPSGFVGYEIILTKDMDVIGALNSVNLEFGGAQDVKILLFNSQQSALYTSKTVSMTTAFQQVPLNWKLSSASMSDRWYVGYLTSGLTQQYVKREFQDSNVQTTFRHAQITPIKVDGHDSETLFDLNDIEYVSETWGMNFDYSTFEDYTQRVINNENRFAKALQLQACANTLDTMQHSPESDRDERITKAGILLELNGNRFNSEVPESVGLIRKLEQEIKRVKSTYRKPALRIVSA